MYKNADGIYVADFAGVSFAGFDDTIYTAVVFTEGDTEYCSGVLSYSFAEYCKLHAESKTSDLRNLAQATIVYSYYLNK